MVVPEAPTTRATMRKQALDFVFLEVMELDPDDSLLKGLNKASVPPSIPAVITLTDTQIASIQVPQDDGSTTRLPIYSLLLIQVLQAWNSYLLVEHSIRRIDWLDSTTMINSESFDEYRVSIYDPNAPIKPSSGLTSVSNLTRRPIREANVNKTGNISNEDQFVDAAQGHEEDEKDTYILVNATKTGLPLCPGDICTVLSSSGVKKKTSPRLANNHETIKYCVSNHHGSATGKRGALVDRGANGGLVGNDIRIMCTTDREVDVSGIGNHQMTNLRIVTAGGVVSTQHGEVLLVMHQ
jgi:hypothetical protein